MEEIQTIQKDSKAEIKVKKSKFIAEAFYVETVSQAEELIKQIKKREHSAKHHCYAYRIIEDNLIQKAEDNGEPSGTAGNPMLSILQGRQLINVLVVVTRYFGGILLGTGGLVKAYSEATTNALEYASIKKQQKVVEVSFQTEYSELETLKHYINQMRW